MALKSPAVYQKGVGCSDSMEAIVCWSVSKNRIRSADGWPVSRAYTANIQIGVELCDSGLVSGRVIWRARNRPRSEGSRSLPFIVWVTEIVLTTLIVMPHCPSIVVS